jgi:hypothetical protein
MAKTTRRKWPSTGRKPAKRGARAKRGRAPSRKPGIGKTKRRKVTRKAAVAPAMTNATAAPATP